jgi:hypothetical protein
MWMGLIAGLTTAAALLFWRFVSLSGGRNRLGGLVPAISGPGSGVRVSK